jgi:hypothetical protein
VTSILTPNPSRAPRADARVCEVVLFTVPLFFFWQTGYVSVTRFPAAFLLEAVTNPQT